MKIEVAPIFLTINIDILRNLKIKRLWTQIIMKISYHRRRKIKTRRIAIRDLILRGIEDPKDLAKELKVTLPTIKRDLEALKTMSDEDLTFETRQTSQEILDKKDMILKMLDDENYYNENGDLNILKITSELNTSRSTVMSVLNGE